MIINLTQGKFTIVSDEDYHKVSDFKWQALKNGNTFYAVRSLKRNRKVKTIRMHRVILDAPDDVMVDHIDGNGLNNLRENIRLCTKHQNQMNVRKPSHNTSGYKGVSYEKRRGNYRAYIVFKGKQIYLGSYKTPEEAHDAYKKAAIKIHGRFARFE